VIPAVSGDEGDGYRCFANEDVGEDAVRLVQAIMRRDYDDLRAVVGGADTEAVSVMLGTILADVLRDIHQKFQTWDPESALTIKMTTIRRGDEIGGDML